MLTVKNVIALFLGTSQVSASNTADETYDNTLQSCRDFAAKFDNTCTDLTTSQDFASLPTQSITCESVGQCPTTGTTSGTSCTWQRKLCVSCFNQGGKVKVRAQTNGLPNHCYKTPTDVPAEVEMDWTVNWMEDVTNMNTTPESVNNQEDLNDLICNILRSKDDNIPSQCQYSKASGSRSQNTAWGFATTGMMFFSGLSIEGVDPFYPAVYGDVI